MKTEMAGRVSLGKISAENGKLPTLDPTATSRRLEGIHYLGTSGYLVDIIEAASGGHQSRDVESSLGT